ncbi:hypothetical protein PHJA_002431300 [Phtheirospermum japonicum]|uniref:Secreted protein n=1 Tax=Phtheirospermum japonicum TaxID=374723 RepID=A0A830D3Q7_9LAMI|nr:hypothetical protein PHJA_002431300 [Phtheirospermum japonicum]
MDIVPLLSLVLVGVHMGDPVQDRHGVPPGENVGERKGEFEAAGEVRRGAEEEMLGVRFDEGGRALRRAKSLRVESKPVRKWSGRDFMTLFFFTMSCSMLGPTRVILCG